MTIIIQTEPSLIYGDQIEEMKKVKFICIYVYVNNIVTEVDSTVNLSTNICNIVPFSITYVCDSQLTAHTCSKCKYINK